MRKGKSMKKTVSVLGFAGYSGSGKTTLIEKLIPLLEQKGIRTAVIKHDAHGLRFDTEGKDSRRFAAAVPRKVLFCYSSPSVSFSSGSA